MKQLKIVTAIMCCYIALVMMCFPMGYYKGVTPIKEHLIEICISVGYMFIVLGMVVSAAVMLQSAFKEKER